MKNVEKRVVTPGYCARSSAILERITDAFYAVDSEWRFVYINKEYERIQQRKREDLLGANVWEMFAYGKKLRFYREYERVRREKRSAHFEEYNPANGMWVRVNAYPTEQGGVAVYFVDITWEKKAETQIFRDDQNLRAIINNTPDIIWSMDKNQKIISANHAFWERIARITGKQTFEVLPEDYTPELFDTWKSYFNRAMTGEAYKITWTDTHEGRTNYEEISFNPIFDQGGNVSGISCFSRNITEQKEYQQKIERQNKQLRQIAWMQSHQVRNHVANIMGIIQLIDPSRIGDPETLKLINCLHKSSKGLDTVVKEISTRAHATCVDCAQEEFEQV
jgi:PAS domain S-box-containing protein